MLPLPSRTPHVAQRGRRAAAHAVSFTGLGGRSRTIPRRPRPPPAQHQPTKEAPASAQDSPGRSSREIPGTASQTQGRTHYSAPATDTRPVTLCPGASSGQGAGKPALPSHGGSGTHRGHMSAPSADPAPPPLGTNERQGTESELWILLCDSGQADLLVRASVCSSVKWDNAPCAALIYRATVRPGQCAGGRAQTQA